MTRAATARIDRRQLTALLRAYFKIGSRSAPMGVGGRRRTRTLPIVLGVYTLFGFGVGAMAPLLGSTFLVALMAHTMTFFVVGTMALNEAAEVLFNARDADVLGHRPVSAPTLVLAKAITILVLCLLMAAAVNLGPCVLGHLSKDARGWFGLVHALSVLVETVFLCGVVVCLYGLITRYLGAARFQKLVTAAQVLATVLFVVGFQVLPRVAQHLDLAPFQRLASPAWLLPPAWFAALDGWLGTQEPLATFAPVAAVGLASTAVLAWFGTLRLPATADFGVARGEGAEERAPDRAAERPARVSGPGWLAAPAWKLWMRDPVERAVFRLCATYLFRDRALKVRLAAGLAYFAVLPMIPLLDPRQDRTQPTVFAWLVCLVPLNVLEMFRISSAPEAAELFLYTPIEDRAALFHGARKAALALVALPLFAYTAAVTLWAAGGEPQTALFLLAAAFIVPPISLLPGVTRDFLPFSQAAQMGERAARVLVVFLAMIPVGIVGAGLYFAQKAGLLFPALGAALLVSIGAHVLLHTWIRGRQRRAALRA